VHLSATRFSALRFRALRFIAHITSELHRADTIERALSMTMQEISIATRKRLSAPNMRTCVNIAKRWRLPIRQQQLLLGCSASELKRWRRIAEQGENDPLVLSTATLWRMSAILGVFSDLKQFLTSAEAERAWLLRAINRPPFNGGARIHVMGGSLESQIEVRRQLVAYVVYQHPPNEADQNSRKYSHSDIIWV
jgi:hypothetical protein